MFLPKGFKKIANFVLNSEQHFISQQNLYCLLTGEAVLYVAKLWRLKSFMTISQQLLVTFKTKLCVVNNTTHFSDIAMEMSENQYLRTDLPYESAQIKLFSRLLVGTRLMLGLANVKNLT